MADEGERLLLFFFLMIAAVQCFLLPIGALGQPQHRSKKCLLVKTTQKQSVIEPPGSGKWEMPIRQE